MVHGFHSYVTNYQRVYWFSEKDNYDHSWDIPYWLPYWITSYLYALYIPLIISIGSMVLLYMVCHGSHQYTPFMLALIYQHHGSYGISYWWIINQPGCRDDSPESKAMRSQSFLLPTYKVVPPFGIAKERRLETIGKCGLMGFIADLW